MVDKLPLLHNFGAKFAQKIARFQGVFGQMWDYKIAMAMFSAKFRYTKKNKSKALKKQDKSLQLWEEFACLSPVTYHIKRSSRGK